MDLYGSLRNSDKKYISMFQGSIGYNGILTNCDTTTISLISGYIVADSRTLDEDSTYFQGAILGPGDITLRLTDWTYFGGHQQSDTTWVDGIWMERRYDPQWVYYSIWHKNYDTTKFTLVGYKYRGPTRKDVGNYYASMVVPNQPGHYEARWVYEKDSSSYAHETVEPFVGLSRGLDAMKDYPLAQPPPDNTSAHDDPVGNDSFDGYRPRGNQISDESPDLSVGGSYG